MRARQGGPRLLLRALVVAALLLGGSSAASPTGGAAQDAYDAVTLTHSVTSTLPLALPERLRTSQLVALHAVGVLPSGARTAVTPGTSSYLPTAAHLCCRKTVPSWAGRAPPPLL